MKYILTLCIVIISTIASQGKVNQEILPLLENGETIVQKEKIETSTWPKLHIYQIVNSTPLEALAIFLALDHQKNYLPALLKSTPIKHLSPTEVVTEYEMDLPWPLSTTTYTHGSNFKKFNEKHYQASWYMLKSESTKKVDGQAVFKEYKGKTLMEYHISVNPKSVFAGIVRDLMVKDTKASLIAIKKEVERVKSEDQPLLKKYISFIERSLKGENVYTSSIIKKNINR